MFRTGEKVTYLDIINAVVLRDWGDSVSIAYMGRGRIIGEQQVIRALHRQLVHGWHAKEIAYRRSRFYTKENGYSFFDHLIALHVG